MDLYCRLVQRYMFTFGKLVLPFRIGIRQLIGNMYLNPVCLRSCCVCLSGQNQTYLRTWIVSVSHVVRYQVKRKHFPNPRKWQQIRCGAQNVAGSGQEWIHFMKWQFPGFISYVQAFFRRLWWWCSEQCSLLDDVEARSEPPEMGVPFADRSANSGTNNASVLFYLWLFHLICFTLVLLPSWGFACSFSLL